METNNQCKYLIIIKMRLKNNCLMRRHLKPIVILQIRVKMHYISKYPIIVCGILIDDKRKHTNSLVPQIWLRPK